MVRMRTLGMCFAAIWLIAAPAWSEWGVQRIELQPGWNAVFLQVQPYENRCDEVFEGVPVESIWMWNKRFDSVQFVQDPKNLVPEDPDWLTWFAPDHPSAFLSDLHAVFSGRSYLVKLGGREPVTVELEGRMEVRKLHWIQNSFNFVGFHVNNEKAPTFQEFLGSDKALSGLKIYRTLPNGENKAVQNPTTDRLREGEAYWIYADGPTQFGGPLKVNTRDNNGLVFGDVVREHTLRLSNESKVPRKVTVRLLPSERPQKSAKSMSDLAGPVALSYRRLVSWADLSGPLTFTLEPGREQALQLAVRRAAMQQSPDPTAKYESVLEVTDNRGSRFLVPVSADGGVNYTGIWAGTVTLNAVSEAGNAADRVTTTPTADPFIFRIILHVGEDGAVHLLQRVSLMQVQAVFGPSADDPNVQEVVTPARYVAITDEALLPQFEGISIRDGQLVGRRISAPAFSFTGPQPLTAR